MAAQRFALREAVLGFARSEDREASNIFRVDWVRRERLARAAARRVASCCDRKIARFRIPDKDTAGLARIRQRALARLAPVLARLEILQRPHTDAEEREREELEIKRDVIVNKMHGAIERRVADIRASEAKRLEQQRDDAIQAHWRNLLARFGGHIPGEGPVTTKDPLTHGLLDALQDGRAALFGRASDRLAPKVLVTADLHAGLWVLNLADNSLRGGEPVVEIFDVGIVKAELDLKARKRLAVFQAIAATEAVKTATAKERENLIIQHVKNITGLTVSDKFVRNVRAGR